MSETSPNQETEVTPAWKSKTLWTAAIVALAPLIPPVGAIVSTNPEVVSAMVGAVFFILRLVTDSKVLLKK